MIVGPNFINCHYKTTNIVLVAHVRTRCIYLHFAFICRVVGIHELHLFGIGVQSFLNESFDDFLKRLRVPCCTATKNVFGFPKFGLVRKYNIHEVFILAEAIFGRHL